MFLNVFQGHLILNYLCVNGTTAQDVCLWDKPFVVSVPFKLRCGHGRGFALQHPHPAHRSLRALGFLYRRRVCRRKAGHQPGTKLSCDSFKNAVDKKLFTQMLSTDENRTNVLGELNSDFCYIYVGSFTPASFSPVYPNHQANS